MEREMTVREFPKRINEWLQYAIQYALKKQDRLIKKLNERFERK